jgi:hypothetical protein
MRPERAWVRLESGRRLNLLQPDPDSWTDRDLALACRGRLAGAVTPAGICRSLSPSTACWFSCCGRSSRRSTS